MLPSTPRASAPRATLALAALAGDRLERLLRHHPRAAQRREVLARASPRRELRELLLEELAELEQRARCRDDGPQADTPLGYRLRRKRVAEVRSFESSAVLTPDALRPWFAMSATEVQDATTALGLTLLAFAGATRARSPAESALQEAVRSAYRRIAARRDAAAVPRVLGRTALATLYRALDADARRACARAARSNLGEVLAREESMELRESDAQRALEELIDRAQRARP
ncbi:MAG: hypothetical protein IT454_15195 [Planctomycetes bacterium]|nr:hypothetical protein [Planctomycetota bacterium]